MKMAIEGSIRKWEQACAGELSFSLLVKYCEICEWTIEQSDDDHLTNDHCANICPLGEIEQCNEVESTFHTLMVKIVDDEHSIFDTVDDHTDMRPLFEKMLSMLKGLLADGK